MLKKTFYTLSLLLYSTLLSAGETVTPAAGCRALGRKVEPIVTCHWDQQAPYNYQCPVLTNDEGKKEHALTGCAATSLSQVLYANKFPEAVGPSRSYVGSDSKLQMPELPGTTFQYSLMRDNYTGKEAETDASAKAVAELMYYSGHAIYMDYGLNYSGAVNTGTILHDYFGYTQAQDVWRHHYTTEEWEALIYNEVSHHRPVLYSGSNESSGHSFVIDGYDGQGKFHVNWGWSGSSDDYYDLAELNPAKRGNGGGASENGYTCYQSAIIGLQRPDAGAEAPQPVIAQNQRLTDESHDSFTRAAESDNFTVAVSGWAGLKLEEHAPRLDKNADIAWALFDDEDRQVGDVLAVHSALSLSSAGTTPFDDDLSFGAGITTGVCQLRLLYRYNSSDPWRKCVLDDKDDQLLLVTFDGNQITVLPYQQVAGDDMAKVNSVTIDGPLVESRPVTAVVNWTKGEFNFFGITTFFFWLDDQKKDCAEVSSYISRGDTQRLSVVFKSAEPGEHTLKITTDADGQQVVYSSETPLVFQEQKTYDLTSTFDCPDMVFDDGQTGRDVLRGSDFRATLRFTNNGDEAYDDYITAELSPLTEDDKGDGDVLTCRRKLSLAAGATLDVPVEFLALKPNQRYMLTVDYFSKGEDGAFTNSSQDAFFFYTGDATAIRTVTAHGAAAADSQWYTLSGRRLQGRPTRRGVYIHQGSKVVVR